LCCWTLALAVLACGTTATTVTSIPTAWKNPAYSGPGFARIFVIAVGGDDATRRLFEDHMIREFARRGVIAVPSYAHLPNADLHSREAIREAVGSGNYDAVAISRLVSKEQAETYVPGRTYETAQTPTGGYYGYYRTSWEVVHEPGYYETNTTVILETNLYDVQSSSLVWNGESNTMNAKSVAETVDSATRAITTKIKQDGLLASPAHQAVTDGAANGPPPGTRPQSGAPATTEPDGGAAPDSGAILREPEESEPVETVPVVRKHLFPLFADKLGIAPGQLPNAYGAATIGYWQEQDLTIKDLTIKIGDGPVKEITFLEFPSPSVENTVGQVRLDAWVLPFLNVSVMGGMVGGSATIPLAIEGRRLAEYFDREDLCDGSPVELEFCSRVVSGLGETTYTGGNVGIGAVLAGGWRNFFVAVPVSYVWTWVSILDQTVTSVNITPRAGYRFNLGKFGVLSAYTGATYLKADIDVRLKMSFDTSDSGIPELGDKTEMEVTLFQGNKDRWNMLVGGNWEIRNKKTRALFKRWPSMVHRGDEPR
jgi:hypothetical protein